MFLLIAVLAVIAIFSAAIILFWPSKRRTLELQKNIPFADEPLPNLRPLFAPSDKDLKEIKQREKARSVAKREYRAKAKAREAVDQALSDFRNAADAHSAAELLRVAAENGLEGDFSRAAEEIIEKFHTNGITGLTAGGFAALVDSHIRLLSENERNSGAIFWLKQEAAGFRSDVNADSR